MVKIKRFKKNKRRTRKWANFTEWIASNHRTIKKVVMFVIIIGAIYGTYNIGDCLTKISYFQIKNIELSGNEHFTSEQIQELAGIKYNQSIYDAGIEKIYNNLTSSPYIKSAIVERKLPDTLRIEVEERKGAAVFKTLGVFYLVDEQGLVLENLGTKNADRWPVFAGIDPELICLGEKIKGDNELFNFLQDGGKLKSFNYIDVSESNNPVLVTSREGIEVYLGQSQWEKKIKRFNLIYQGLRARIASVKYIDLRYHEMVIVKQQFDV